MKNRFFPLLGFLFLLPFSGYSVNYYFSSAGDDSRSSTEAQSVSTPWRTLDKLQSFMAQLRAGDTIFFHRDETFPGSININVSGSPAQPLVFAAYGTGQDPVLTGLTSLSNWSPAGNNIWESTVTGNPASIRMVLLDNRPVAIGRYPNSSEGDGGYLQVAAASGSGSITMQTGTLQNWSGAELVIRKNHWVLDRSRILSANGSTLNFNASSGYNASAGAGYFIQDHPGTLDQTGEWYYIQSANRLGMYFGQGGPTGNVKASTYQSVVKLSQQSWVSFNNLVIQGGNTETIGIDQCSYITFKSCSIRYSGNTAVRVSTCDKLTMEAVNIDYTNNIAMNLSGASNLVIRNCRITNTGLVKGSGESDSGSYEAVLLSGDNQLIEGNTIVGTGYIPITFNGNDILIKNNFIDSFGTVKDDGSGIYTWNNLANAPVHYNRIIEGNIILHGLGGPEGTTDHKPFMHGIYMDDNADHVTIRNNTVAHTVVDGLYIHNAHNITISDNTFFNNANQVSMVHDQHAGAIRNIDFRNNILFSRTADQPLAAFRSIANDLQSMGSLNGNYYCRPMDEINPITASWQDGWGWYNLESWKAAFGHDQQSFPSPVTIQPYHISNIIGQSLFTNTGFVTNLGNLYAYASSGTTLLNWVNGGPLDAGQLKFEFGSGGQTDAKATLVAAIGPVRAGKHYVLRYDVAGITAANPETYLRKSLSPYTELSERRLFRAQSGRQQVEVWFTANADESNASLAFDFHKQSAPVYLDNIVLQEAGLAMTNPDDSIRFHYNNSTSSMMVQLDGLYIDARNTSYPGSIMLDPFSSAVLIRKTDLTTLPLSVINFNGEKLDRTVLLTWELQSTGAGSPQQIERSSDGRNFSTIGEQLAEALAGTASYRFIDASPLPMNYYRIRYQQDDGSILYSKTISIQFTAPRTAPELTLIPDASQSTLRVSLANPKTATHKITITSIDGRHIRSESMQQSSTTINTSSLTPGTYLISITDGPDAHTKRFIKTH